MDGWLGKLVDMALGGLPGVAAGMVPAHLKRQWLERLSDHDPFKTISANHDLVRATRLAWVEAAQEILAVAKRAAKTPEWAADRAAIEAFHTQVETCLSDIRHHALDRRRHPGDSPIDRHLRDIIRGAVEVVAPGDHKGIGASVTHGFAAILAELTGWSLREIPGVYDYLAQDGLPTLGGGPARPFGELVFAAFAEMLKAPDKYPEAREAFRITMDQATRDVATATLDAVRGLDTKLDELVAVLDGQSVLRSGAARYLDHLPQIARDTAETRADVAEILRIVSQRESVPLETLRAILAEMGESAGELDAGEIGQRLAAKAAEFKALVDRLNRLSNDDPAVRDLRHQATQALNQGQFAKADAHLAAAEARDLAGLDDLEALARQKRLSAAESRAERGAVARMRPNPDAYREAAAHYGEAARIARPADEKAAFRYETKKADALRSLGDEFGLNAALVEAVDLLRQCLGQCRRDRDPDDWASTQNNLGNALSTLGERESGTSRLEEAVAAYRSALEEYTRDRVPLDWAMTQNNLGTALWTLGARESGTSRLEDAVVAYRSALEEYRRDRVPLDWAKTQNNLGIALSILGTQESGTSRLEAAVAAYRSALEERRRDRVPLEWAATQNNLGTALRVLGTRESGTSRLEEAVVAYRSALEERRRDRVPLDWAATQNNLGAALWTLGERESGTSRLEDAVVAYRSALEEYRRDRVPLDWAKMQNNLGTALRTLGERESGTSRLEEAVAACRSALEEYTRDRAPLAWAATQNNLGGALSILGGRESGTSRLEAAVVAYRLALEEYTRDRVPLNWAGTQNNLGFALQTLGGRESGTSRLEEAVAAYRSALEEYRRDRVPLDWAMTQNNLGNALSDLGGRESGTSRLEEAVVAFESALEEWTPERFPHYQAEMQEKIAACRALIEARRGGAG